VASEYTRHLVHETEHTLRDLLIADLKLGTTFARSALIHKSLGEKKAEERNRRNALNAIETVSRLCGRLAPEDRDEIVARQSELSRLIASI
jgi:hypothetical protein